MHNKVLLVGINAKYIHSNLAIRYLQKYAMQFGHEYVIREYTINQQRDFILSDIYRQKPDILGFSCYIWNIVLIKQIISDIKKIMPETVIVLGGPEITGGITGADYTISGDGEETFFRLVSDIEASREVIIRSDKFDFKRTVFPYSNEDFNALNGRIIYYEAQRGCPFKCAYCLSQGSGVRFLPVRRVLDELSIFLERRVKQVKLVDRTFNCDKTFRREIWNYLIENDNGVTNFHFEIKAELLDEEDFAILAKAREALFQFEIGVQSTADKTLSEIDRTMDFSLLSKNITALSGLKNIHLHLDLIAGLPYEDMEAFKKSFNDVFSLCPDALQLGFLKVLKGGRIYENAAKYGIKYSENAPYQVLSTNALSYGELLELKNMEHMLETYYNSGLAMQTIKYIIGFLDTPFEFFHSLGQFWNNSGYFEAQHTKMKIFEILLDFFEQIVCKDSRHSIEIAKEAVVYDILLNDNIKTFPEKLDKPLSKEQELFISHIFKDMETAAGIDRRLLKYNCKQLRKQCNVHFFEYAVNDDFEKRDTTVFFHYLSGKGSAYVLDLEERA